MGLFVKSSEEINYKYLDNLILHASGDKKSEHNFTDFSALLFIKLLRRSKIDFKICVILKSNHFEGLCFVSCLFLT